MPVLPCLFSSKVRNKFLFQLPSFIWHHMIYKGLYVQCKPTNQMTPMHQLQAVLTCTVPKAEVVLTLVQLLTSACFSKLGSKHPQNESRLESMLIPVAPASLAVWSSCHEHHPSVHCSRDSECPCEAVLHFESMALCLLRETEMCLSFRSQPTGKQGQPDCFRTDGFLPCSGISLAKWSLTILKYQTQLYVDL